MAREVSYRIVTERLLVVFVSLSFFALSIGTAPLTICSLAALAFWLVSGVCFRARAAWSGQEWFLPVVLLLLFPWLALLWSSSPDTAANVSFASRSYYWLFAFVAATCLNSEAVLRRVLIGFIAGTGIIALAVLLHSVGILPGFSYLTVLMTKGYITYSLLVVVAIVLLAFFFRSSSERSHKLALVAAMVLLATTIAQLSGRSGYLALALLSPWIFITMFGSRRLIFVLVALLLTGALLATSRKVQGRISAIQHQFEQYQTGERTETSIGLRIMMWKEARRIFGSHPIIGAGTGGYQYETTMSRHGHGFSHPHSSYLYVASNYGVVGILLYGWLFMITMRRAWRARGRLHGYSILAFLSVIMIGSLTDTQILSVATGIALGFITGIPTAPPTECASS